MNFKDIFLLPNLITLTRFFTSIALFIYFTPDMFSVSTLVIIVTLIGLSDSLDGIVARKFNLVSKLGTILDPFTDRVVFIILLFWLNAYVPSEILYFILIREMLVLIGSLYVLITGAKIQVSNKGKLGTVLLFITVCLFIINSSFTVPFLTQIAVLVIIFYFYVAIEYLYNLIYKSG